MPKINYYSINEPVFSKYSRRFFIIPLKDSLHRAANRMFKVLSGNKLPFPQNIHLELTNNCNLRCLMCPVSQSTRKTGFMDFKLFEKIVKQCRNRFSLEKMALMGFGEPFLHPEIIAMSKYAKEQGVRHVFTSTNATLLNAKLSEDIILRSGFDLISFSIDGARKETYESIRRNASFEKVLANIETFLEIRSKYKRSKPIANIQILVMEETQDEIAEFVEFWKKKLKSRDIIFIRDVDTFGGQVSDHRISRQLPKIKRFPCVQLWRDFLISWDGSVTVCCKDAHYRLCVGNVREDPIAGIWKNNKWEEIRQTHRSGNWDRIPLCRNCSEWNQ